MAQSKPAVFTDLTNYESGVQTYGIKFKNFNPPNNIPSKLSFQMWKDRLKLVITPITNNKGRYTDYGYDAKASSSILLDICSAKILTDMLNELLITPQKFIDSNYTINYKNQFLVVGIKPLPDNTTNPFFVIQNNIEATANKPAHTIINTYFFNMCPVKVIKDYNPNMAGEFTYLNDISANTEIQLSIRQIEQFLDAASNAYAHFNNNDYIQQTYLNSILQTLGNVTAALGIKMYYKNDFVQYNKSGCAQPIQFLQRPSEVDSVPNQQPAQIQQVNNIEQLTNNTVATNNVKSVNGWV